MTKIYKTLTGRQGRYVFKCLQVAIVILAQLLAPLSGVLTAQASDAPTVFTDKLDYAPGEPVIITGVGFSPNTAYDIPVVRPDGSIIVIDDVGNIFYNTWDTVVSDEYGGFVYDYRLNGILGQYWVYVYLSPWSGDLNEDPIAYTRFTDAGGDVALDFTAAAPYTYDHFTGGGAYNDRTVGKYNDIVESLEGGDFTCGDIVTFLTAIKVKETVGFGTPATLEIDYSFLADTTGQSGVALGDITGVSINYGGVENGGGGGAGTYAPDTGMADDLESAANLTSESLTGAMFSKGAELLGTVVVTDVEPGEQIILRIDVRIFCQPGSSPTGNLQGALSAVRITLPDPYTVPGGEQTIPFKSVGQIAFPTIDIEKHTNGEDADSTTGPIITVGDPVHWDYIVTNTGNTTLTGIVVSDDQGVTVICPKDWLDPLESMTCSASGTAVPGQYANLGTVTGYYGIYAATDIDPSHYFGDELPTIDVTKTASPTEVYEPVDDVLFTVVVENTSTYDTLTLTVITDDENNDGTVDTTYNAVDICDVIELAPGALATCFFTRFISGEPGDIFTDVATAYGYDAESHEASDSDDATVTVKDELPEVDLVKDVSPASRLEPGGVFHYTLTIYNKSVEPVKVTALTDDNPLPEPCTGLLDQWIPVGGSLSCTYDVTHTEAGSYPNTASVTVKDNEDNSASDSDSETVIVTDVKPVVDLVKDVTPASRLEPGGVFHYTLTIYNTSVEPVKVTALTDDNPLPAACTGLLDQWIPVGGSLSCTYDVTHTEAGSYPNTASVTVKDNEDNPASDSDSETVIVTDVKPTISVTKTAYPTEVPTWGTDVTFTIVVTNLSPEVVELKTLVDDKFGDLSTTCGLPKMLAATGLVGDSFTCMITRFISGTAGVDHKNTVTAKAYDNEGNKAEAFDEAIVGIFGLSIDVEKFVSADGINWHDADSAPGIYIEAGNNVYFKFVVTNTSSVTVVPTLKDSVYDLSGCVIPASLAPAASFTCTINKTALAGAHLNTATATGAYNGWTDDDTDDAHYFGVNADIEIIKKVGKSPTGPWVDNLGEVVASTPLWFQFTIKNMGNVPLSALTLEDTLYAAHLGDCVLPAELAVGGSFTCVIGGATGIPAKYNNGMPTVNWATAEGCFEGFCDEDTDDARYTALYWAFTPGFWKNHADYPFLDEKDAWQYTAYEPSDNLGATFDNNTALVSIKPKGTTKSFSELTLLEALKLKGGPGVPGSTAILMRAAVASLLNASFHEMGSHAIGPDGVFPYSSQQIIDKVNVALLTGDPSKILALASELDMINNGFEQINWLDPYALP